MLVIQDLDIKTNFYKLSADPELDTETTKDLEEMEKSKTDLEKRFNLDMRENHEIKEPEPEPEPEDELEDESSKKDKPRNLFDILKFKIRNSQAIAIWNFLKETNPKRLKGLSLGDIIAMNEEQRAELVGIEYKPGPKSPSNRILNTNIGRQ